MKNIVKYKIQALACLFMLTGLVFLSSCEEEEEPGDVVLLSFGPSGVHHGDEIIFVGQNLDKVTAIVFQPSVEVSTFVDQSSDRITVVVPEDAEAGKVTLKAPSGDIESQTILNFEVPVVITSITAEARPGSTITITGDKLNWIEEITFPSDIVIAKEEFESLTLTELVVTVPMNAQTGYLLFATGGTEPLTFGSEEQLIVTLPTVASLTPSSIRHTNQLTISGANLDLVTEVIFSGGASVLKENFVSQIETAIVLAVPATTLSGVLTLKQASPVDVTTGPLTIILPVGTSLTPQPAVPGSANITITGTNLDLVAKLTLAGVTAPVEVLSSAFITHTATQIVLALPLGVKNGAVSYTTIHGYSANLGVNTIVPGAGPPPLAITLFDDEIFYGGGDWSWGASTSNPASGEQFYSGTKSWKHVTAGGDGGASAGGMSGVNATALGVLKFSLYGGPGTDGKQVAAVLGSDGSDKWDSYNSVTLVEGEWTEYSIPLSSYPTVNFANVTRWIFKVEGGTNAVLYVDRVGFDPAGPPPLDITIFDEALAFGGGDWGWNAVVSDRASTEESYTGNISWKFETASGGGLSAGGMTAIDASGETYFTFSVYGGTGTNGVQLACILNDNWNDYNSVTLVEGQWTEFQVPLSAYPTTSLSAIVRFALKVESTASVIYVDRIGFK